MRVAVLIAAALAALSMRVPQALAQEVPESHLQAARELLEVTNTRAMMDQTIQLSRQLLASDSTQAQMLAEFGHVLDEFIAEQFSWAELEPEILRVYVDVFTEGELRELTAFYRTELGQKLLVRMPEVMQRSMAITQRRMGEMLPRLTERLQEEMRNRPRKRL